MVDSRLLTMPSGIPALGGMSPRILILILPIPIFLVYRLFLAPLSRLPGPWGTRLSGLFLLYFDYIGQRNAWIISLHEKYGPVVRLSPAEVSFSSPEAIRDIYTGSQLRKEGNTLVGGQFHKGFFFSLFTHFGAVSTGSAVDPDDHRWRRKIVARDFLMTTVLAREAKNGNVWSSIGKYFDLLQREGEVPGNSQDGTIRADFHSASMYFAGDAVGTFIFGNGILNALDGDQASREVIEGATEKEGSAVPIASMEYIPLMQRLDRARMAVMKILCMRPKQMIPDELDVGFEFKDWAWNSFLRVKQLLKDGLLDEANMPTSARLAAHVLLGEKCKGDEQPLGKDKGIRVFKSPTTGEETGRFMGDLGAAAEAFDAFLAGVDTASDQSSITLWVLALHPEWQGKIRNEIGELFAPRDFSTPLPMQTLQTLMSLPILHAVLMETIRIYYAAAPSLHREVPAGGRFVDGYWLPEGTTVAGTAAVVNRDALVFNANGKYDALRWLPERWLDGGNAALEKRMWSFGSGARGCIGKNFALLEIKLLLSATLLKYKIAPVNHGDSGIKIKNRQWTIRKTARDDKYFPDASGILEYVPVQ